MTNGLPQAPAGAILADRITASPCRLPTDHARRPADPPTRRPSALQRPFWGFAKFADRKLKLETRVVAAKA